MNNKKGISAVVATVLIILITVAAVTIIWAAIIPMINDQLSRGTICLDAATALSIENKGYTCQDAAADQVKIQVKHGSQDVDLAGIQVLIGEDGSTSKTDVTAGLPGINEEKVLTVAYTETGAGAQEVRIAPMINVGNSVETCDASAAVALEAC